MIRSMILHRQPMAVSDQRLWQGWGERVLTVRQYRPGDEDRLTLRPDFFQAFEAAGRELPPGPRWTLAGHGDKPLAIGGLELLKPGVFGAWGLAADLEPRAWAFVRRAARQVMAYAERELKACTIKAQACATIEAVGLLDQMGFARVGDPWTGPDGELYVPMERSF